MERRKQTACPDWIGAILRAVSLRMYHLCAGNLEQLQAFNRGAGGRFKRNTWFSSKKKEMSKEFIPF